MESQSQTSITKVTPINKHITSYKEKMNNRMARLLWQNKELQPSYTISAPRTLQSAQPAHYHQLENPLVLGSILAGVVGVVIIAVIILVGKWIHSRVSSGDDSKSASSTRQNEHVEVDSTVIMSSISMSTLDFDEYDDETRMESLQLDDTTFHSANDVSIPVEGSRTGLVNSDGEVGFSSYQIGSMDERTLCDITLSPI